MITTSDTLEKLQEIIDTLEDSQGEKKSNSLTKNDVMVIYRISRIAADPHVCPFSPQKAAILNNVADNVSKTQKIAAGVLIAGVVSGILGGSWKLIVFAVSQFITHTVAK